MVAVADGLVVATYDGGILRIAADGCSVEAAEAPLAGRLVVALDAAPTSGRILALLAPKAEQSGGVLESVDDGKTWVERGAVAAFGSGLLAAPSDADRVYVTAQAEGENGAANHQLLVSEDGGAAFSSQPLTLFDSEVRAYLLGVDPTDAERVFIRVMAGNPSDPERLLLSEDGGASFSEVASAVGPLVLAFRANQVWLGAKEGLFRSEDGGHSFQSVSSAPTHVGCLASRHGSLTVCGYQDLEFGVFELEPEERRFRPLLRFSEVTQQVSCGDDAEVLALCSANFDDWLREQAPAAGGEAGAAGVTSPMPPHESEDAGCRFGSSRSDKPWVAALLLGLVLNFGRRSARRRRP